MMRVSFNHAEEFLGELVIDPDGIQGKIVRLTLQRKIDGHLMTVSFALIGTAVRVGELIVLERPTGGGLLMGVGYDRAAEEACKRAESMLYDLTQRLEGLGFDVRAGVYGETER